MMKRNRKRLWALLLSAALIVTQLPAMAGANTPEDGAIASFEPLPGGVAKQTVDVGTELSELNLPDTVTAAIHHVTEDMVIPDEDENGDVPTATPSTAEGSMSGNGSGDSSNQGSGKTVAIVTTSTEEIPVTWDSDPAYDCDTAGTYVFTADVGDYTLSRGAKLPRVTVTVSTDAVENPPKEPLPCTKAEGCTLVDGHEGRCVPAPPVNGALVKSISGTWNGNVNREKTVITVPANVTANVTLNDTVIDVTGTEYACAFTVAAGGEAHITLSGDNTLKSAHSHAGLEVPEGAAVTIGGDGSLELVGGTGAAGIGGGNGPIGHKPDAGNITISSGTVVATGGAHGAGIGGGYWGNGGTTTISGGMLQPTAAQTAQVSAAIWATVEPSLLKAVRS